MKKVAIKLAVSIVIFNPDLTLLEQVLESIKLAFEDANKKWNLICVIDVIDNNPNGGYSELVENLISTKKSCNFSVHLIKSARNGGYGFGNNLSISSRKDFDFHLVLNPDVILSKTTLSEAFIYLLDNPSTGLLTPLVRGLDGELQYLCKQNPTLLDMIIRSNIIPFSKFIFKNKILQYEMRDRDYFQIISPIPYPTGCFMLFDKKVLSLIGGFDEVYFLHYEDADIGRKVSLVSLTTYVPTVTVTHKWSRDTHKNWHMKWITMRSGLRYWWKWNVSRPSLANRFNSN